MRFKSVKMIMVLGMACALTFGCAGNALAAASSVNWKVDYTTGAPSGSANPVDEFYVGQKVSNEYTSSFKASCKTLTGSTDRIVTITTTNTTINTSSANIRFTTTGSRSFHTKKALKDTRFRVVASGSTLCSSTGTIENI